MGGEYTALNPMRDDRHIGSFKINESGCWSDFATGDRGGDVINLVAYLNGCSQVEAACWLETVVGGGAYSWEPPKPSAVVPTNSEAAMRLWGEAVEPRGTVVEAYLWSRRLDLPDAIANHVVRFHPRCPYGPLRRPCMIVMMRSIEPRAPQAIMRTAIATDGTKIGRKALGPVGGAVIMLDDLVGATELTVSEGFETASSGNTLSGRSARLAESQTFLF